MGGFGVVFFRASWEGKAWILPLVSAFDSGPSGRFLVIGSGYVWLLH
jgi:hypothetical protein